MSNKKSSIRHPYLLPGLFLISGLLVGASFTFFFEKSFSPPVFVPTPSIAQIQPSQPSKQPQSDGSSDAIKPVNLQDHIRGRIDAPVKIVEFSDFECPFCKSLHPTLHRITQEYGDRVAWIFRHSPLDALHPKARMEAIASECANELGGNKKFWQYIDKIFEITPANNGLDLSLLPQIAQDIGLDRVTFEECQKSGRHDQRIENDIRDAQASGARGTPYSVLIGPDGKTYPVSGAQPFSAFKMLIDIELK